MIIGTAAMAMTGCVSMKGVNPAALNEALFQPWTDSARPPAHCFNTRGGATCLLPGMELRIEQTSGLASLNREIPVVTSFGWVLPEPDAMTRRDLFALSYLMTAAHTGGSASGNASACYEAWLRRTGALASGFYMPLLKGLLLKWDPVDLPHTPSAIAVQQWMRRAPAGPPVDKAPAGQYVSFEMPVIAGDASCAGEHAFTAFDHGSAWSALTDDPGTVQKVDPPYPAANPYYAHGTLSNPRTLISVFIPVTMNGARRFIPIESSVDDLERDAGVEVSRVYRAASLAPIDAVMSSGAERFAIQLTDAEQVLRRKNIVPMPHACAADILLAPGDEIVFSGWTIPAGRGKERSCVK